MILSVYEMDRFFTWYTNYLYFSNLGTEIKHAIITLFVDYSGVGKYM